jgi:ribosomal protein S2
MATIKKIEHFSFSTGTKRFMHNTVRVGEYIYGYKRTNRLNILEMHKTIKRYKNNDRVLNGVYEFYEEFMCG